MALIRLLAILYPTVAAAADCTCGYLVGSASSFGGLPPPEPLLFTHVLETDFLHIGSLSENQCWTVQTYNVTPDGSRRGRMASPDQVMPQPESVGVLNQSANENLVMSAVDSTNGNEIGGSNGKLKGFDTDNEDFGLELWVGAVEVDGMVPVAELVSGGDMLYGSYRIGMKVTSVPGTVSAFFLYRNNMQEIDMEFLSSKFASASHPVYLVMQTPETAANGYNANGTSTFAATQLPFSPSDGFHEYRFDWTLNRVAFYADGQYLDFMVWTYPEVPGHLTINHWSDGNGFWSQGPPKMAAKTVVSYVKAYYNTSDITKQAEYGAECHTSDNRTCLIPDSSYVSGISEVGAAFFVSGGSMCGEQTAAATSTTSVMSAISRTGSITSTITSAATVLSGTTLITSNTAPWSTSTDGVQSVSLSATRVSVTQASVSQSTTSPTEADVSSIVEATSSSANGAAMRARVWH